jgi:hypothetical protein
MTNTFCMSDMSVAWGFPDQIFTLSSALSLALQCGMLPTSLAGDHSQLLGASGS